MLSDEIIKKKILVHKIRKNIYFLILKYPGIHYNELLRKSNLASGQLTYHLKILTKNNLIYRKKDKVVNYYSIEEKTENNEKISKYLRDKNKSKIILELLKYKKKHIYFSKLANNLNMKVSTLSWHIKTLEEEEIIFSKRYNKKKYIYLNSIYLEDIEHLLNLKNKTIISKLVDSFIEFWDEG